MAFDYITEAFKRLAILDEETFNASSYDGINSLKDFVESDDEEIIRVIDPEAENEEELQDSYVGKVIVNCNVCHSHIFEPKEEIVIDEEGNVNPEVACPYCGESEGFKIVGEIAPYNAGTEEDTSDDASEEPTYDENSEEAPSETEEILEESVTLAAAAVGGLAGLAGGAIGSKLFDDVNDEEPEQELNEDSVEEALVKVGDISIDASGLGADSSVGFLGGTATKNEDIDEENRPLRMSRSTRRAMQEDFKEVSITTEDQKLEMSSDENGKVTVTTEPVHSEESAETIVPVSDETQDEILSNNNVEEDELDFDFDEMDEDSFNELGEAYFKRVYENVDSFKTEAVSSTETSLIVEGTIGFKSGVTKHTGFIFEAKDVNNKGRLRFIGKNKQLTESSDAFSMIGVIDNKKLFIESLKYNYKVNNESVRGLVRRK